MIIRLIKATRAVVRDVEYNPRTQYRYHLIMAWLWLASMIVVAFVVHPHGHEQWLTLAILEVSLYANFSTEFGSMSSSMAATYNPPPSLVAEHSPFANPNYKPDIMAQAAHESSGPPPVEADF